MESERGPCKTIEKQDVFRERAMEGDSVFYKVLSQTPLLASIFIQVFGLLAKDAYKDMMASFQSHYRFPLASNGFVDNSGWAGTT